MTGDTHYDLEILAELAEGLLDAATAQQVREHLAACSPCGELLADLAAVREVLAATPTPAMPMGVALRIDRALAAEAGSARGGGVGLVESPDWDELMRDAPWEEAPEPVRLGVVADDGSVVRTRRRASTRRRRWAMPAVAAAAAAAVVGSVVVSSGLLTASGGEPRPGKVLQAQPAVPSETAGVSYMITDSGYNYSEHALKQPLVGYFGPYEAKKEDGGGNGKVAACVSKITSRTKLRPIAVDQSQYNGQEALVIASWKDQARNKVRVDVVDPFKCKAIRKPVLGRWK